MNVQDLKINGDDLKTLGYKEGKKLGFVEKNVRYGY